MYGAPGGGPRYEDMRAADADRNRAIDVLKASFTEGRLTYEELTWREGKVLTARTYGELAALIADLPAGPLGTFRPQGPPGLPYDRYPVPYPRPPAVPARNTNSMAVASLVSAFVPIPVLGAIMAIVTGHLALEQTRRTGESGRGMAMVGLVLGYLEVGLMILILVAGLASGN